MRKYPLSLLKDKNIVTFFDFWGKTRRGEKDGGDDYHLLCWHSLDVAAMGYLMVNDVCLTDGFRLFLKNRQIKWQDEPEWRITALALIAAVSANVKAIDERQPFAAQLAAVMSKGRFTRLSAVKTPDELLRQLRRAVRLLNGSVNLDSLAEGVFRWCQESDDLLNHHRRQQRPTEFIRIRWALEYYQAGDADNEQNQ
ncbi:TPA: type I-E CRISPR-associated protein Cse2/CasB [Escherichia coli]|nr:type I-E CRISPR-associated protein Cse2/CasB [Escherichia coli]